VQLSSWQAENCSALGWGANQIPIVKGIFSIDTFDEAKRRIEHDSLGSVWMLRLNGKPVPIEHWETVPIEQSHTDEVFLGYVNLCVEECHRGEVDPGSGQMYDYQQLPPHTHLLWQNDDGELRVHMAYERWENTQIWKERLPHFFVDG
jgi:hypothetical protein